MPYYSDNSEYGYEKMLRNPKNGGRWDLKNTGQFYSGINVVVKVNSKNSEVVFRQKYNNEKIRWLEERLELFGSNRALGISKNQIENVQIENKPKLREQLEKIISGV